MKRNLLVFCFAFILFSFTNETTARDLKETGDNLDLKGLISDDHLIRSLIQEIFVLRTSDEIDITFNLKCSVKISVINVNDGSIVYEKYVDNTQTENKLSIKTASLNASTYKLIFQNTKNLKTAYGYFVIQ